MMSYQSNILDNTHETIEYNNFTIHDSISNPIQPYYKDDVSYRSNILNNTHETIEYNIFIIYMTASTTQYNHITRSMCPTRVAKINNNPENTATILYNTTSTMQQ